MCLGIPGQIVEIVHEEHKLAKVSVAGVQREVNIACIMRDGETAADCVGAWVLVHVGFAMARIDEEEAARTLELLEELAMVQEELGTELS